MPTSPTTIYDDPTLYSPPVLDPDDKPLVTLAEREAEREPAARAARRVAPAGWSQSRGAKILVFPEYSVPCETLPALRDIAREGSILIVAGTHCVGRPPGALDPLSRPRHTVPGLTIGGSPRLGKDAYGEHTEGHTQSDGSRAHD